MPPSNAMENDKKRLRNQFTKDERTRLLAIMTEYGPLLDDKNISILSRKEIWEIIENKFNENGHSGRTSAQLKKYWQNYKYHSKRTKIIHKEVPKPLSPMTKHMVRMLAKVDPEEWAQYNVAVNTVPTKKSPGSPRPSPSPMSKIPTPPGQRSSKSSVGDGIRSKSEISESNVVVSTTDVPGSSVTVSVICPEVTSKARTVFWKRNMLQSNYSSQSDDLAPEVENSNVCSQELADDPLTNGQTVKLTRQTNRLNVPGNMLSESKSERSENPNKKCGRYVQLPEAEDALVQSVVVPRQRVPNNRSPTSAASGGKRGRTINQSESIGNAIGVVKAVPKAASRLSEDCDPVETPGPLPATNGKMSERPKRGSSSFPNPFSSGTKIPEKDIRVARGADHSDLNGTIFQEFSAVKESLESEGNFRGSDLDEKRELDTMRRVTNPGEDSSTQDLIWLKLYLRLLRGCGQAGGTRRVEMLRKFGTLVSTMSSGNRKEEDLQDNGESSDTDRDQGMEVDEEGPAGRLRVRRVSLMPPAVDGDEIQRDIKVEAEIEPGASDVAENPLNDNAEDGLAMNSMNYLAQAKLQYAKSELDHQLKLQKLEMEEKELRVRIAEMTVQETRLRIQALIEERLRATEIHELRIAQMAAEKVRSEAEHAARVDASCISRAEGQARINSIERDRERSENFYQMQIRCMGGNNANGNSCGMKCKQYQQ